MPRTERLGDDLILIDTGFNGTPRSIGAYLLLGDRPALIETGPQVTLEAVVEGIREAGVDPDDLKAVAVTHIHLDHAGAAGDLARRYPGIEVYVHPMGAPHLLDPSKLLSSARRLYGDEMDTLLGTMVALPGDRVRPLEDGERLVLGSRAITALASPGHAAHHVVYFDEPSGDLFTGDAAGMVLGGSRHVRVPTPPPELDVPTWIATLDRLRSLEPRRLLLTHYGAHREADSLLEQAQRRIRLGLEHAEKALRDGQDEDAIAERLAALDSARLAQTGAGADLAHYEMVMPSRYNALGLARYVRKRAEAAGPTASA